MVRWLAIHPSGRRAWRRRRKHKPPFPPECRVVAVATEDMPETSVGAL